MVKNQIILCGLGRVGWRVLEFLQATSAQLTVIDTQLREDDPRLTQVNLIHGDCRSPKILEQAQIQNATGIIIVTSDDLCNISTALLARKLNPTARIVVRMFNQNLIHRLSHTVANTVALSVSALTAPFLATNAMTGDTLQVFDIGEQPQQISEIVLTHHHIGFGSRLAEFANRFQVLILGYQQPNQPAKFYQEIPSDTRLAIGDTLTICGNPKAMQPLFSSPDEATLNPVQWASRLSRWLRTVSRTFASMDRLAAAVSVILFFTLFFSSIIFRFGVGLTWADSFYETVSLVATGGDLHGEGKEGWVKVFIGSLKIVGAAIIAAFTAILTNVILKARLGGAFEIRKIPVGGHVVVCGLGNIGYRCVEKLLNLGCQVVAVDLVNDNPFAATVRRMGAAVIVGDATVQEVLRQARADTARAVIATTSVELANLEIALLVRELNPKQRVILRLADPEFAQTVREAADIRFAVSPPALAAPAFAAALYGDHVHSLIRIGDRTLALVRLTAQADDDTLAGRSLQELMIDQQLLILGIEGQEPFAEAGVPKHYQMKVGDQLIVAVELMQLEKALRRQSAPAEWLIEIVQYPAMMKDDLLTWLRTKRHLSAEEADAMIAEVPFILTPPQTLGQAEEIMTRFQKQRVELRRVHVGSHSRPAIESPPENPTDQA